VGDYLFCEGGRCEPRVHWDSEGWELVSGAGDSCRNWLSPSERIYDIAFGDINADGSSELVIAIASDFASGLSVGGFLDFVATDTECGNIGEYTRGPELLITSVVLADVSSPVRKRSTWLHAVGATLTEIRLRVRGCGARDSKVC